MKDWQFFLAIIFLFILLLPIYEPYSQEDIIKEIGAIKADDKKNNESIGNLTNKLAELRTDQAITQNQISGNTDNLKSLISNTCPSCPVPIPTICPTLECEKIAENIAKNANIPNGTYTLKYKDKGTYCSDVQDQVVCSLRNTISRDEKMQFTNLGDGYYSIKGGREGKYCADEGNNVVCNRDEIGPSEKFKIMDVGEGYYNLIGGKNGKYCESDNFIKCEKDKPGAMDKIEITPIDVTANVLNQANSSNASSSTDVPANVPTGVYSLKQWRTKNYCSDLEGGLSCDKDVMGSGVSDLWKVINLGDGNYNFKGGRANQYCKSEPGRIVCNTSDATQATKFKITDSEEVGYVDVSSTGGKDIFKLTPFIPLENPFENKTIDANLPTGVYTIQNFDNKYCSDLENEISCANDVMSPGTSSIWKIINLGDGNYNLKGGRANQFCRIVSGGLLCDTSDATQALKFKLEKSEEGYLYIIVPDQGRAIIKITPYVPKIDPANIPTGVYTIQSGSSKNYCSDLEQGMECDKDVMGSGTSSIWKVINLGDGKYNLKGGRENKYCYNDGWKLICNRDATQASKYEITKNAEEPDTLDIITNTGGMGRLKLTPYVPSTDPFA